MKRFFSILSVSAVLATGCNSAANEEAPAIIAPSNSAEAKVEPVAASPVTTIQWVDSVKHIGKVSEGEKVQIEYKFINTGSNPLVISNVIASCGCTVAEKPEAPIAPGKEGFIKASFDSKGRVGSNHKTLTVIANTAQANYALVFDVEVIAKK